jgi:hypothetical protein
MVLGIPGTILGLLIGYENMSLAGKKADWQVLWDVTMTPLLSDLDDVMNLSLVPEFSGIDEVLFDRAERQAARGRRGREYARGVRAVGVRIVRVVRGSGSCAGMGAI